MKAQKILSLVNVSKQFGHKTVLSGVNLDVYEYDDCSGWPRRVIHFGAHH